MLDHFWRATKSLSPNKPKAYPPTPPSVDYNMNEALPGLQEAAVPAQDNMLGAHSDGPMTTFGDAIEALQSFNEQPLAYENVDAAMRMDENDPRAADQPDAEEKLMYEGGAAEDIGRSAETPDVNAVTNTNGQLLPAQEPFWSTSQVNEDDYADLFEDDVVTHDQTSAILQPHDTEEAHDIEMQDDMQPANAPASSDSDNVESTGRSETREEPQKDGPQVVEQFPALSTAGPVPSIEATSKSVTPEAPPSSFPAQPTSVALATTSRRARSEEPQCTSHYSSAATWPPSASSSCDPVKRIDLFPPKDAPLHVWMQAYALRWGTWTAEIKDNAIRQQVLNSVTEKMKAAWETGIAEGFYARPSTDSSAAQQDDSDGQHKSRKRALSFSKQPAGWAYDGGKDKLAITNGELAEHGLTFDQIKARVESGDYDAGEIRLQEVYDALGRETIKQSDWSINRFAPVIHGRNLLMYALFVVSDTRQSLQRLKNLYSQFTKENQKRNTQARIDTAQEREYQHLALATELALQEKERKISGSDEAVDLTSESGEVVAEEVDINETPTDDATMIDNNTELIIELTEQVLKAASEGAVMSSFTQRNLQKKDFDNAKGGLNVGGNEQFQKAKVYLDQIFELITMVFGLKQNSKAQQPQEIMRRSHDVRLAMMKLAQQSHQLHKCLFDKVNVAEPFYVRVQQHILAQAANVRSAQQGVPTNVDGGSAGSQPRVVNTGTVAGEPTARSLSTTPPKTMAPPPSPKTPSKKKSLPLPSPVSVPSQPDVVPPAPTPTPTDQANDEAANKKAYIAETWVPMLNRSLKEIGKGQLQETVDSWPKIKNILNSCGYTPDERNNMLKQFKSGFETWCAQRGIRTAEKAGSGSSAPTAATTPTNGTPTPPSSSPRPAVASSAMPGWPTNAEIMAAIPPQGIAANVLIDQFRPRIGNMHQHFIRTVQQLCNFNPNTYMVYPRQATPQAQAGAGPGRQYNTLPPNSHLQQAQARPSIKLNVRPPSIDESSFPEEYKSTEVNSSRGFFFRHLPHATLEQRQRMDEVIDEYITETKKSRSKRHAGQYVTLVDPENKDGGAVAHGFWEYKDGGRPEGSEWFFNGEHVPEGWNGGEIDDVGSGSVKSAGQGQGPRIKLKLPMGGQAQVQGGMTAGRQGQDMGMGVGMGMSQGNGYNVLPPGYQPQQMNTGYGYGRAQYPQTVAPAQLSAYQPADRFMADAMAYGGQNEDALGGQRGTKREASGGRGGRGKKKRKVVDDSDDEYTPDQDY